MSKFNVTDLVSNLSLEAERKFAAQSNRTSRVKIEKGHAWLIRFLPFAQGPQKQPFARIAQHWVGGRAFCCKRHTAPDFGGDPDAYCPVCDVSEEMHGTATDQTDKDAFYGVQARIAYRAYCLVFSKEDNRGKRDDMTAEEVLTAHEFMIPKTSFATLAAKIDRSKGRAGGSPLGLLDLETGSDLWAARDIKNSLTFDLSETGPGPIFDLDDAYDTKMQRVWKQLKQPTITFFSDERLNAIADMVAEKAFEKAAKSLDNRDNSNNGSSSRGGTSPRGGSHGHFHEAEHEEPPARGRTAGRNNGFARAQAALEEPQNEHGDPAQEQAQGEDQVPGAEVPAQEQAPVRRRAPVQTAASAETEQQQPEAQDTAEAPPVTRRAAGAPVRRAPAAAAGTRVAVPPSVGAARRTGPPQQPGARTAAPTAQGGRVEEETVAEDPPEEQKDPAPPADGAGDTAEAPPARATTRTTPALQGALRQSVSTMASRGR